MPRSSSGLGRWPLTPVTRVRVPYGVPIENAFFTSKWRRCFFYGVGTASTTSRRFDRISWRKSVLMAGRSRCLYHLFHPAQTGVWIDRTGMGFGERNKRYAQPLHWRIDILFKSWFDQFYPANTRNCAELNIRRLAGHIDCDQYFLVEVWADMFIQLFLIFPYFLIGNAVFVVNLLINKAGDTTGLSFGLPLHRGQNLYYFIDIFGICDN